MKRFNTLLVLMVISPLLRADAQFDELRAAAEQGEPWAQLNLGAAYDNGLGVVPDAAEALRWYRRSAEQGLAEAQFNLGHSNATGHGVAQDYREAVVWLGRAAEKGLPEAQHLLAVCYFEGLGVSPDRRMATQWLQRAAANHYQPALDYAQRRQISLGEKP